MLALLAGRGALAQPEGMLAGNLSSVGSDTLANLMALWAQDFSQHYPNVNLQIRPPALPRRPRGGRRAAGPDEPADEGGRGFGVRTPLRLCAAGGAGGGGCAGGIGASG